MIRAADDPSLNYNIRDDTWEEDDEEEPRPKLKNHGWAAEILCAPMPF